MHSERKVDHVAANRQAIRDWEMATKEQEDRSTAYALRVAAGWIERLRGEADDEDVAWVAGELKKAEAEIASLRSRCSLLESERDIALADRREAVRQRVESDTKYQEARRDSERREQASIELGDDGAVDIEVIIAPRRRASISIGARWIHWAVLDGDNEAHSRLPSDSEMHRAIAGMLDAAAKQDAGTIREAVDAAAATPEGKEEKE